MPKIWGGQTKKYRVTDTRLVLLSGLGRCTKVKLCRSTLLARVDQGELFFFLLKHVFSESFIASNCQCYFVGHAKFGQGQT